MNRIFLTGLLILTCTAQTYAQSKESTTPPSARVLTQKKQQHLTPEDVLKRLKDGNQRFSSGKMKHRDWLAKAVATASGQFPAAVILNCMDSRTPPELVFDQGLGDVFAIRIAGNIQNNDILGSMEFGTQLAGSKLIVVMGHTHCGAVRGACQRAELGNLTTLLQKIQPAVQQATQEAGAKDCDNGNFINQIAKDNVLLVIKQIQQNSPLIQKLLNEGKIGLIGAIQDIATGKVTFFDDQAVMPKTKA